jgi:hypothetical protein
MSSTSGESDGYVVITQLLLNQFGVFHLDQL